METAIEYHFQRGQSPRAGWPGPTGDERLQGIQKGEGC